MHYLVDDKDGGNVQLQSDEIAADFVADGWRETDRAEYEDFRQRVSGQHRKSIEQMIKEHRARRRAERRAQRQAKVTA